jgi:quercetin dioxygenase-like cupin family protein
MQIVQVGPLGSRLESARTATLIRNDSFEILRLIVPAGGAIPPHQAPGTVIIQCVEGDVELTALGRSTQMVSGDLLYLPARVIHTLQATANSSLLVTILHEER